MSYSYEAFVHFQAAALSEAVAAMVPSEGDSKLMERAVSRGSSSTGKAKIDSKSAPSPTSMAPPSSSPQKGAAEDASKLPSQGKALF